jgi:flagellar biosynthesis/type III secretory pathway M-ring protein FliF/YscJ
MCAFCKSSGHSLDGRAILGAWTTLSMTHLIVVVVVVIIIIIIIIYLFIYSSFAPHGA